MHWTVNTIHWTASMVIITIINVEFYTYLHIFLNCKK